jgi:hypothetical protein
MLRIDRFVIQCRAPRHRLEARSLADSIAREEIARELGARLGPSLPRQAGVVRIRRLRVRIEVRGRAINRSRLIDAWVRAICRQLFTALAYPHGGGQFEIHRAATTAAFRAEFIRDLLSGAASGRWEYRGREALLRMPRAEGVRAALSEAPGEIADTLAELAKLGSLESAVAILDDLVCEQLFRRIATSGGVTTEGPWEEILALVTRVLMQYPPSRGLGVDSRAQALRMFALAQGMDVRLGPRVWLTVLTALALLAANGELWTGSPRTVEQICGLRLSPDVIALLEYARGAMRAGEAAAREPQQLRNALKAAGLREPEPVVSQSEPQPWREYEGASLLFLTGPLLPLGWAAAWSGSARQAALYALGCAVRGVFDPAIPWVDRDAALFAGLFEEASASGLRALLAATPPPSGSADWPSAVESFASRLITVWASGIPGFRRAGRDAIVRQFLKSPGRLRVEESRVLVSLAPRPFFVALRIASLDEPVERVPWFGDRRLEFRIEGL